MNAIICKETFRVRTSEIGIQKSITIPAFIQLMQEAAMQNVIQLGVSVWDLAQHNISWVLMRKRLHIHRLPSLNEKITVITHPAGFEKFFTYRDYKVYDEQDNLLASSSSTWLLMDTVQRRMTRIPEFITNRSNEIPPVEDCLPRIRGKLPKWQPEMASTEATFQVRWHDLDFNHHLGNVRYIQWMLESMPTDFLQKHDLKILDLHYHHENKLGDILLSQTQALEDIKKPENLSFLHRLKAKGNQQISAMAKTQWIEAI